jgi:hypothetical protein
MVKNHNFTKVAFADPLKRVCQDIFKFSAEQLWGPSEMRNVPDTRYRREPEGECPSYLTPRHTLQQLGTEWGRQCYPLIWVEYALRVAKHLLNDTSVMYTAREGIVDVVKQTPQGERRRDDAPSRAIQGVVISDMRFHNEVAAICAAGGKTVRIVRKNVQSLEGAAGQHASETKQQSIPDELFNYHLINSGNGLDLLAMTTAGLVEALARK